MKNSKKTGPPTWRLVLYGIIAMAIPVYFNHPRLEAMHEYKYAFWITVLLLGILLVCFGIMARELRYNKTERMQRFKNHPLTRIIVTIIVVFVLLFNVCKLIRLYK